MSDISTPGRRRDAEVRRAVRRPAAILSVAGYPFAAGLAIALQAAGAPSLVVGMATLAIFVVMAWAMYVCYRFRGRLAQAPDHMLDERQIRIRDRAYLVSYRIFAVLVLGALASIGLVLGPLGQPAEVTPEAITGWLIAIVFISISLPSSVVAWQERDLPVEA